MTLTYPFGTPLTPRPPSARETREVFVLGAYPSALHVRWVPPQKIGPPVAAIPIADEPSPFWDGMDAEELVADWRNQLPAKSATWGTFTATANLNGPSGRWVDAKILGPLEVERCQAWITDCLDTYRMSTGVAARLANVYQPGVDRKLWPAFVLATHPSESQIVREAVANHRARVERELADCRPDTIVTLGNAAARVLRSLVDDGPSALQIAGYGAPIAVNLGGRSVEWLPLAHPAAPTAYQAAHNAWIERRAG